MVRPQLIRLVVALGATLALVLAAAAPAGAAEDAQACANASARPATASPAALERATLCLLNAERASRGLRALRHNRRLARAGRRHAAEMVRLGYFSHESRDGADFVDRIVDAGYVGRRERGWLLGENLAYGVGEFATPGSIFSAWMRSRGHRANILRRGFREVGVAVVRGAPVENAGDDAATFATEFGRRR